MSMRPETDCRRPDFKEGIPVKFSEGREFSVRRPSVRFAPSAAPDENGQYGVAVLYVYEGDRSIRQTVKDVEAAENGRERLRYLFRLATSLLRLNYDLSPDDLAELLSFDADDPAGGLMLLNCHAVAIGRDPNAIDEPETEAETEVAVEATSVELTP